MDFRPLDSHAPGDARIGALGRAQDGRLFRRIVEAVVIPAIRAVDPAGVDSKTKTDMPGTHAKDIEQVRAFAAAAKPQP